MLIATLPVFVRVTFCVALLPSTTLPKFSVEELGESVPVLEPPPPVWSLFAV